MHSILKWYEAQDGTTFDTEEKRDAHDKRVNATIQLTNLIDLEPSMLEALLYEAEALAEIFTNIAEANKVLDD